MGVSTLLCLLLLANTVMAQVEFFNASNKERLYSFAKQYNLTAKFAEKIAEQTHAIFPIYILLFEKTTEKIDGYILTPKNQNLRLTISKKQGLQKITLTPIKDKYFDRYDIQEYRLDYNNNTVANIEHKKYIFGVVDAFNKEALAKAQSVSVLMKTAAFYNVTLPASINAVMASGNGEYLLAFVYNDKLYDRQGVPLSSEAPILPVKFNRVSSLFSENRFHPILGYSRAHKGVDLAAKEGSLVFSVLDGHINDIGYNSELGNYVKIRHKDGFESIYGHLSRVVGSFSLGTRVAQGDIVGLVGKTGLATGAHLHFGVKKEGDYIDPAIFFKKEHRALSDKAFFSLASKASEKLIANIMQR